MHQQKKDRLRLRGRIFITRAARAALNLEDVQATVRLRYRSHLKEDGSPLACEVVVSQPGCGSSLALGCDRNGNEFWMVSDLDASDMTIMLRDEH